MNRDLRVGVDDHAIAELDEAIELLRRQTEDGAEHADRDQRRDVMDEADVLLLEGLVEDLVDDHAQLVLVARDRLRCEVAGKGLAPLVVQRRVGLHEVAPRLEDVGSHVTDAGGAAATGREDLRALEDVEDIGVLRHAPEAVVLVRMAVDGRLALQPLEDVPRLALGEQLVVEQIELRCSNSSHALPPPNVWIQYTKSGERD